MMHVDAVVVLEVMWGDPRPVAPGFFRINPNNFSGRRLHYLLGAKKFLVTNACRECVANANQRGTPDPKLLARNLHRLTYDVLILGGRVAQSTFEDCYFHPARPNAIVYYMKHPAARTWTKKELEQCKMSIANLFTKPE